LIRLYGIRCVDLELNFFLTDPKILIFTWNIIPAVFNVMEPYLYTVLSFAFKTIGLSWAPVAETKENRTTIIINNKKNVFTKKQPRLIFFNLPDKFSTR